MLKPKLTRENAAALRSNAELELLLTLRFSKLGPQEGAPALALDFGIAWEFEVEVAARPPLVPSSDANEANPIGPLPAHEPTATTAAALFAKFTPVSAERGSGSRIMNRSDWHWRMLREVHFIGARVHLSVHPRRPRVPGALAKSLRASAPPAPGRPGTGAALCLVRSRAPIDSPPARTSVRRRKPP